MLHKAFSGKKGFLLDEKAVVLVLAIFVLFIIINTGKANASGIAGAKLRHAQEISLLLETASVADGNFFIKYPHDISKYWVKISNKEVMVSEDDLYDKSTGKVQFVSSLNQYFNHEFIHPSALYVYKIGNRIYISDTAPIINQMECPDKPTTNTNWPQSKMLLQTNSNDLLSILKEPSAIDFSTMIDAQYDSSHAYLFVLGISSFNTNAPTPLVKIYYLINSKNQLETKKLGCLMLNEWSQKEKVSFSLIPITVDSLAPDDPKLAFFTNQNFLKLEKPMIYIETDLAQHALIFKSGLEKALVKYYT